VLRHVLEHLHLVLQALDLVLQRFHAFISGGLDKNVLSGDVQNGCAWHPKARSLQGLVGQRRRQILKCQHVFSGGDGIIYAVESMVDSLVRLEERTGPPTGGRLFWYRHLGWADGSGRP